MEIPDLLLDLGLIIGISGITWLAVHTTAEESPQDVYVPFKNEPVLQIVFSIAMGGSIWAALEQSPPYIAEIFSVVLLVGGWIIFISGIIATMYVSTEILLEY